MNRLPQICDRSDSLPSLPGKASKRPAIGVFLAACVGAMLWPMVAGNAGDDSWSMDRIVTKAPEFADSSPAATPVADSGADADFRAQRVRAAALSGIRGNHHVELPYKATPPTATQHTATYDESGADPGQPPHQDFRVIMPVAQRAQPRMGPVIPRVEPPPQSSGDAGFSVAQEGSFNPPLPSADSVPVAQNPAFFGKAPPNTPQSTEDSTPHVGSAGDLIVFSGVSSSGSHTITVIHTRKMQIAVYHVDRLGKIQLKSSRPIDADFSLTFNATAPLPQEIRQMATEVK